MGVCLDENKCVCPTDDLNLVGREREAKKTGQWYNTCFKMERIKRCSTEEAHNSCTSLKFPLYCIDFIFQFHLTKSITESKKTKIVMIPEPERNKWKNIPNSLLQELTSSSVDFPVSMKTVLEMWNLNHNKSVSKPSILFNDLMSVPSHIKTTSSYLCPNEMHQYPFLYVWDYFIPQLIRCGHINMEFERNLPFPFV